MASYFVDHLNAIPMCGADHGHIGACLSAKPRLVVLWSTRGSWSNDRFQLGYVVFLDLAAQHRSHLPVLRIFESSAQSLNSVGIFLLQGFLLLLQPLAVVTRVLYHGSHGSNLKLLKISGL